ncbi:hypothetical protein PHLGIDRAFT_397189 [Phlebiopsis gigantea 11061_1 CR5-6]|uniref:YDG domain-containing protein n=1 Tax=Phlebiopsis gigantea (strain 11061_1 CR5-6) TaxID=745531 RepID=A0A0C3PVP6_PHLG1|nr:hypothetical protein PHLGIDRAFT_397189 [Phlebiopsis gigantea 11061_1 CR5-6]
MLLDFEEQREANIAKNLAVLMEFGIEEENKFIVKKKVPPKPKKKAQRKRKEAPSANDEDENGEPPRKTGALAASVDGDASAGPRRSGRNAGKKIDYAGDGDNLKRDDGPKMITEKARAKEMSGEKGAMKRLHDPKTFGAIPSVEVGKWWETRMACSADAIHAPWVAGISGGPDGCYSVALSGGYEDDVDLGVAFTYTGSGGRDLKGTKQNPKNLRTAPQSSDQSFEHRDNKALLRSVETQNPVRVIRGFKLKSQYAPREGYRYDGLYTVEKAWREKGMNAKGLLVCKFAFKVT